MNKPILYLVSPCFNERDMLKISAEEFKKKIELLIKNNQISEESKILFVDDGSDDNTWKIIKDLTNLPKNSNSNNTIQNNQSLFKGIKLSRNKGHQNALLAGLMTAKKYADIVISLDADLQDDVSVIDEMINKYKQGAQIVYAVRYDRKKDTMFKRSSALLFYKFLSALGVESVYNHADYRLTTKAVLDTLENYSEVNLYLRAIFPQIGFKQEYVYYKRKARVKGESKYSFSKMISLAIEGITSFSVKPLRIITNFGIIMIAVSILVALWLIYVKISGGTPQGLSFIAISIWLLGGVQLCSVGIVGEYVGKIYLETKSRPRYIIEDTTNI